MASTLKFFPHWSVQINGQDHKYRTRDDPAIEVTLTDPYLDLTKTIAATTTWDAWTTGAEEPVTDFDFLMIVATGVVMIELTVDQANDVGDEIIVIQPPANFPFFLGADDGLANYTADFGAITADVIDRIRIRNNTAAAVDCRIFLGT